MTAARTADRRPDAAHVARLVAAATSQGHTEHVTDDAALASAAAVIAARAGAAA